MKYANKRVAAFAILLLIAATAYVLHRSENSRFSGSRQVTASLGGQLPVSITTHAETVQGALEEIGWPHAESDNIWPSLDTRLSTGMQIRVWEGRSVQLFVGGEEKKVLVAGQRVQDILDEEHIALDPLDLISPPLESYIGPEEKIEIIRVTVTEETEEEPIAFSKKTVEDEALSWRVKKVTQPGKSGTKKNTYQVSRHNDEVVERKLLASEVLVEPEEEITTVGTKVEVGKKHTGLASWYAHTGTLAAANPWLPLGSYVRVTNTANGKSVIVKINDRGPFGPGRIIDLDKVAFQMIASLGTGVVSIVMEEITN